MPRNPHRPGSSAAQSFREDEVKLLHFILRELARGARVSAAVLQSDAFRRLARKSQVMKLSLERQLTVIDGGRRG